MDIDVKQELSSYISATIFEQIKPKLKNWKLVDELKLEFFLLNMDRISLAELEKIKK